MSISNIPVVVAAVLLTASCATSKGVNRFKSLDAPTKPAVEKRISAADAGRFVEVQVGTTIAVELIGVPTTGYLWSVVKTPPFLQDDGDAGGSTSEARLQTGVAGGNHWEVFFSIL
jgi:hypothetical protein